MRADPKIGTRELARRIAMATSHRCSESTAHTIRNVILARSGQQTVAETNEDETDTSLSSVLPTENVQ